MNYYLILFILVIINNFPSKAQNSKITGIIRDKNSQAPVANATIKLQNASSFTITDVKGMFSMEITECRICTFEVIAINYKSQTIYDIDISLKKENYTEIELSEKENFLDEVIIKGENFHKTPETPLSLKSLSASEIERMPGGLRDISRALQAFPGVAIPPAWRNDLIVRGGASYENKFYLEGIPIPSINHFTPQGSSGGAYGIINPNYLRGVDFYAAAFPASKGDALSSVFDLKLKDGDPKENNLGTVVGTTDLSVTADGQMGHKTTYLVSARVSNWKLISNVFGLPILPRYDDLLIKLKYKPSVGNEFSFLVIGTSDYVEPNLRSAEGLFVDKKDPEMIATIQTYLRQISVNRQKTYMVGAVYKHFFSRSYLTTSISQNYMSNSLVNHTDQLKKTEENKFLNYHSKEFQNAIRIEYSGQLRSGTNFNTGLSFNTLSMFIENFNIRPVYQTIDTINYRSNYNTNQYGAFFQLSHSFARFNLSFGARTDFSNYSKHVGAFYKQISPRLSASYKISRQMSLNLSTGIYHQLPLLTLLSYRNNSGRLENTDSLKYMRCIQSVIGIDFLSKHNMKISIEVFLKNYANTPFLKTDGLPLPNSISLISQQSLGLSPAVSSAHGRSYGLEILVHQKLWKGFYGIASYSLMKSEYTNTQKYIPSNWDYRHIISLTAGKLFKRNWEIGAKIRVYAGGPFTPLNYELSSNRKIYDLNPIGIPDITKLNSQHFPLYHALDLRVEKRYTLKKLRIGIFLDVQNCYNTSSQIPPFYRQIRDIHDNPTVSPSDPTKYVVKLTDFKPPFNILPTGGISINMQ